MLLLLDFVLFRIFFFSLFRFFSYLVCVHSTGFTLDARYLTITSLVFFLLFLSHSRTLRRYLCVFLAVCSIRCSVAHCRTHNLPLLLSCAHYALSVNMNLNFSLTCRQITVINFPTQSVRSRAAQSRHQRNMIAAMEIYHRMVRCHETEKKMQRQRLRIFLLGTVASDTQITMTHNRAEK